MRLLLFIIAILLPASLGEVAYNATGVAQIAQWGGQTEPEYFATSYIPNLAASATIRTADNLSMPIHTAGTNKDVLPTTFGPSPNPASKLTVEFEARCQFSSSTDIGSNRHLVEVSGNVGTASATRNRLTVYISSTGRIYGTMMDNSSVEHSVYSTINPINFNDWFKVRVFFDLQDFSREDLWVNGSNIGMTKVGNAGTGTWDTANNSIRQGQDNAGVVDSFCSTRNERLDSVEF